MPIKESNNQVLPISLRMIARRAGVSLGTVSNVLNHPELVSPAKREVVLKVLKEANIGEAAVKATRPKTNLKSMGIMIPTLANPFYVDLSNGFQEAASLLSQRIEQNRMGPILPHQPQIQRPGHLHQKEQLNGKFRHRSRT